MVTVTTNAQHRDDLTTRRLRVFEQRYGSLALDLACHAAFPLTLTTDLVYCLRENFVPECPWYGSADVLLSGLCSPIGYDLYEMEGLTRDRLLRRLCQSFGKDRLAQLEDFMVAYIRHRLQVEQSDRPLVLGDRPHWTALACLRSEAAVLAIEQDLRRVITGSDPKERLRLAALVERTADLLAESKFRPLLLDWANRTAQGQPIDDVAAAAIAATQSGITLKTLDFESVTLVSNDVTDESSDNELKPFRFETVTVDLDGQIIRRERKQALYFIERLGERKQSLELEMVAIPSGTFLMGTWLEAESYMDEEPQHEVTLQPFFISKYPITQAQWAAVATLSKINLDLDLSYFKGDQYPAVNVSWLDAVEFCERLSYKTGRTYRLPTEAEWEYACRAGTTTPFHFGETITVDLANYDGGTTYDSSNPFRRLKFSGVWRRQTTVVHQFAPNQFGLYDMHGNVWEWCLDHWHGSYKNAPIDGSAWLTGSAQAPDDTDRILRGGSWDSEPKDCRSARRNSKNPIYQDSDIGFRVVCVP